jgi:uncharacterized membrane protein YtjA (UPF0391 family)
VILRKALLAYSMQLRLLSLAKHKNKEEFMLRAAIIFFVLGLAAMLLGAYEVGGLSIEIGKVLLVVFLIFAVISFIASIATGNKKRLR